MARTLYLAVAVVILAGPAAFSQQNDLDRIVERDRIALQKLQAEVNHALAQSRVLERADPAKAADLVQEALAKVKNTAEVPADERARLLQRLQVRQRELTLAQHARRQVDDEAARRAADKQRQEGRGEVAGARSKAPTAADGPAAVASKVFEARSAALNDAARLRGDRATGANSVLSGLDKTAVPFNGVIEYPKDWDKISQRSKPKLTEREVALLRALNSTMSVNFDKTKFRDAIDLIQERASLTILIEEASLKDAMADYDDPVTFKGTKLNVRTILKKVLADRGLSYVIKEGSLHVVTPQKAREHMVVRAYPVAELLGTEDRRIWGPLWKRAFELQHAQTLVNMIQTSVDPAMWNVNGGPGSVTFHEGTQAIIIRASAEMHYVLNGQLH